MRYIRNLTDSATFPGKPWEFTDISRVPENCLGPEGKKVRHEWILNPQTDFHCYSLAEGINYNARISTGGKDDDGNPPAGCWGIPADYDYPLTDAEISAGIARMDIQPNWRETTLSGNCRLLWLFPEFVRFPSRAFAKFFLEHITELLPIKQLAGLDEGALHAIERHFTNGCKWQQLSPNTVPLARLRGFLVELSAKFDWKGPEFGAVIPLEIVSEQLRQKFPTFASWPGNFELGAMGPSFWVAGSESAKSAIVRETGIQTFANHASKGFFSWAELIGADFCNKFKTEQMGKAVEGIYYDEKHYYSKNSAGIWCIDPKENIVGLLKSERGLSDQKRKGEHLTEVEKALAFIQRNQRVKTAASFAFFPEGITKILDNTVLNTHTRQALPPAAEPAVWGPTGKFPFISQFLDTLFTTPDQLPFFLSWSSYFYKACHVRSPRSGHAVFIAGGTNVGKTFLTRGIIGGLVGGFAEPNDFLLGTDSFNGELCDCALWTVDDGSMSLDVKSHRRYSEMVKRVVANPSMRCNNKFVKASIVAWLGRLMVTLNTDPKSVQQIPDTDLSLLEKIMIFRAVEKAMVKFLPKEQMEEMLARELPHLARFLLDYQIPPQCLADDPRFMVREFHEPTLISTANQSSPTGTFAEILVEWQSQYFGTQNPFQTEWKGSSFHLYRDMSSCPELQDAMKAFPAKTVAQLLVSLAAKKTFDISVEGSEISRVFTIRRDQKMFPIPERRNV